MKQLWITKGSGGLESAFGLVAACLRWRVAPLLGAVFTEAVAGGFLASFALAFPAGPLRAMVSAPAGRRATIGRGAMPKDPGPQRSRQSCQEGHDALAAAWSHVSSCPGEAKDIPGNLQLSLDSI